MKSIYLALLLGVCVAANAQQSIVYDSTFSSAIGKARLYIDSIREAQNIPAISVAVGVNGKLVWAEAAGVESISPEKPATVKTKFRVGSISKTMTAFALGKLYEQGSLKFSDTVARYLPSFKKKTFPVTIRQLAGHQGGVRHYRGMEFLSEKQYGSVAESMSVFENDPLLFEPGTKYSYSTYGYVALSRIIEVATGLNYLDYMSREVFRPLDMNNTVAENAGQDETGKAVFYSKNGRREADKVNLSSKWAGGGFLSTPTDLVNMVNNGRKIMSARTLFMLVTPQKLTNGQPTDYGMGWRYTEVNTQNQNRILVHHGGTSAGARAFLLVLLNEQIVIAICTNSEADYDLQEVFDLGRFFL